MPIIKTIKPAGGGDYSTLQAWEDFADGEATADQWAECYSGNLGAANVSGWTATPNASLYPRIYAADGHEHDGQNATSGAYISGASGTGLTCSVSFTRIEDLGFSGAISGCQVTGVATNVLVSGCLADISGPVGISISCATGETSANNEIRNCLVMVSGNDALAFKVASDTFGAASSLDVALYNCTAYRKGGATTTGFYFQAIALSTTATLNATAKNCVAVGFAADFDEHELDAGGNATINLTPENNISSDGTADDFGGSDNQVDRSAGSLFVDPANDNLQLRLGSPAIDAGQNLYSDFEEDILGNPRPAQGPWDVGAFAYQPTAVSIDDVDFDAIFDDPNSLVSLNGYDSRSNRTLLVDPKQNTTVTVFDGASRPTMTQEHLRQQGQGQNPPAANETFLPYGGATIRSVTTDYDGNSRAKSLTDDNGNVTRYVYDTLDRQAQMEYMDGSTRQYVYNEASNVTQYTDENGSVFDNTFDAVGRRTQCAITPASGVAGHDGDSTRGTTEQVFEYDGVSRLTKAVDTTEIDDASPELATVELFYDSLSRVLEDSQVYGGNTRNATNETFESFPVTQMAFPNGRQTTNDYDDLYRRVLVEETSGGADIAAWEFFGPSRVAEMTLGNGLICSHLNNARTRSAIQESQTTPGWGDDSSDRLGYDGAGRMITKRYLAGGIDGETGAYNNTSAVVGQTTAYDKSSNKFYERSLQAESRSSLYEPFDANDEPTGGYDSINRLRQYQRGVLSSTGGSGNAGGGSVTTPISLPNTDESRDYDLDGLGNWRRTTFEEVGAAEETQIRQHNSLNEITSTKDGSDPKVDFAYDGTTGASNGNLANDGTRTYEWDALNRLKKVYKTPASPVLVGEYTYDALGRRIRTVVTNDGLSGNIPNGTTDFLYHGGFAQCCEERNGSNELVKQYVWGIYIDELLQQKTFTTINGNAAGDYYPLSDTLYRTVALTDDTGALVETYDTDAYGNTLIFTAPGTGGDWWADDATQGDYPTCEFIFTGRRYDSETEIDFYRGRYYGPVIARFLSRDPVEESLALYAYVHNNPVLLVDPLGTRVGSGGGGASVGTGGTMTGGAQGLAHGEHFQHGDHLTPQERIEWNLKYKPLETLEREADLFSKATGIGRRGKVYRPPLPPIHGRGALTPPRQLMPHLDPLSPPSVCELHRTPRRDVDRIVDRLRVVAVSPLHGHPELDDFPSLGELDVTSDYLEQLIQDARRRRYGANRGRCSAAVHLRLQAVVQVFCHGGLPRESCRGMNVPADCARIRTMFFRNLACALARIRINAQCFDGGDAGHFEAQIAAQNASSRCLELMQRCP